MKLLSLYQLHEAHHKIIKPLDLYYSDQVCGQTKEKMQIRKHANAMRTGLDEFKSSDLFAATDLLKHMLLKSLGNR